MLSAQDRSTLHTDLMTRWPHMWTPQRSEALADEFCYVPASDLREAIHRHAHDATEDNRNVPLGQFPPTAANIEAHLGRITAERIRQRLEEEQRQRDQESHQTYQEMLGQRESTTEKGRRWGQQIRLQMARAQEIRKAVQARYGLDFSERDHERLVMRVLGAAKYEGWEEDATEHEHDDAGRQLPTVKVGLLPVERALQVADEIAESMGIARRHGKAA